jgi:RNA polymerase sigma factor (sigma-70 family)
MTSADDGFEAFFARYETRIMGYLWRMTGDEQSAFDLSQEAFLRAWQHFTTIQRYPHPEAWLFRVATNLALHQLRRRASPIGAAVVLDERTDPGRSDPAMRLAEHDAVRRALDALVPRARALLILREVVGLSGAEAAEALGMTPLAAKTALFRAREQFRRAYLGKGESA